MSYRTSRSESSAFVVNVRFPGRIKTWELCVKIIPETHRFNVSIVTGSYFSIKQIIFGEPTCVIEQSQL